MTDERVQHLANEVAERIRANGERFRVACAWVLTEHAIREGEARTLLTSQIGSELAKRRRRKPVDVVAIALGPTTAEYSIGSIKMSVRFSTKNTVLWGEGKPPRFARSLEEYILSRAASDMRAVREFFRRTKARTAGGVDTAHAGKKRDSKRQQLNFDFS